MTGVVKLQVGSDVNKLQKFFHEHFDILYEANAIRAPVEWTYSECGMGPLIRF